MQRRNAITLFLSAVAAPRLFARLKPFAAPDFAGIERRAGGRLGVAVLDTTTGSRLAHRADEPFPMCSTFKWLLAAQVLSRIDAGVEQPTRVVKFGKADLLEYAPVARVRIAEGGMPVADLAAASVQVSDNTAANLLLQTVGGPAGFTAFLRGLGDNASRLDRIEPDLNSAEPGDLRDTTTPNAMVADMERLLLGDRLRRASRDQLVDWMIRSTTGADRLRAGVPSTWRVGDKTGTGARGATNDVAIMWPPARNPVLVAAYLTETTAPSADRSDAHAAVGREIAAWLAGS